MGVSESTLLPPQSNASPTDGSPPIPSQEPLEPRLTPLCIFHQHTRNEETLLRINGRFITHLNVDPPASGSEIFMFRQSPIGFSKRPTLLDVNGRPILNITKRFGHRKFDIRQGEGRDTPTIALVHTHKVGPGWDISTSFSNANDGMALTFKLSTENKGGRNTVIRLGGVPIARVRRTWEKWGFAYYTTVAAGVDLALVTAIVTCMEIARPKG